MVVSNPNANRPHKELERICTGLRNRANCGFVHYRRQDGGVAFFDEKTLVGVLDGDEVTVMGGGPGGDGSSPTTQVRVADLVGGGKPRRGKGPKGGKHRRRSRPASGELRAAAQKAAEDARPLAESFLSVEEMRSGEWDAALHAGDACDDGDSMTSPSAIVRACRGLGTPALARLRDTLSYLHCRGGGFDIMSGMLAARERDGEDVPPPGTTLVAAATTATTAAGDAATPPPPPPAATPGLPALPPPPGVPALIGRGAIVARMEGQAGPPSGDADGGEDDCDGDAPCPHGGGRMADTREAVPAW